MRHRKKIYIALILIGLIFVPIITSISIVRYNHYDNLKIAILKTDYKNNTITYPIGFNYEFAKYFCKNLTNNYNIILTKKNYIDSLSKSIDILIMPYNDSLLHKDNYYISKKLINNSVWVVSSKNKELLKDINNYISHIESNEQYKILIKRFSQSYHPNNLNTNKLISPYDDIIKKNATIIGWDWKLIAAMIWKESQFKIGVQSARGAKGLMQLMPQTAKLHDINPIDPNQCIEAGCKHINRLQKIFSKHIDKENLNNIVLAAYNAGEGNILSCIKYAKENNLPYKTWSDIENVIKTMQKDSTNSSPKFKGTETINYVKEVNNIYSKLKDKANN